MRLSGPSFLFASLLAVAAVSGARADTMSFAQAGALLARSCGPDIEKFCATANLGGGQVRDCLAAHEARINPQCVTDYKLAVASLMRREAAQASVPSLCATDASRYCPGVKPGKAHIVNCLNKATKVVSATCQGALADAGWN